MTLSVCSLGSGSKGNSVYVTNGTTSFLIDCGLSIADITMRLSDVNAKIDDIRFVLITHEHFDHVRSVEQLSTVYNIPIYSHRKTMKAIYPKFSTPPTKAAVFSGFGGFIQYGLFIKPFFCSHDVFTVGYSITDNYSRIVYATDLGHVDDELLSLGKGADIVMLESNYDETMLKNGTYPYFLKKRILSNTGHLANTDCAETICKLAQGGTKKFILGHLSAENNTPQQAYSETMNLLNKNYGQSVCVSVALQNEISDFVSCR
jgi:phosphoribosyl 1,2-cyclic phosphodiesterase